MSEIIAILIGAVGILFGALTVQNKRASDYKTKTKELEYQKEIQDEITDTMINHSKQEQERSNNFKSRADGTIKKMIILFCLSFIFTACSYYTPNAPKLYVIDKPKDFTDIDYKHVNNSYCFDEKSMKELLRQIDWSSNAIKTYEKQITIYNKYLKGVKK